jgi:septal ring factor EnvC (AmiA/AmiB activator)
MAAPGSDSKASSGSSRAGPAACGSAPRRLRFFGASQWPRAAAALALLVAALVGLPRPSQAGLWSADTVAAYGLEADLEQLGASRERIGRREALRQALRRAVGQLSREIGTMRRRAEQAQVEIGEQGDAVRAQEQTLDRVVPRLVARLRAIEERRGQAARALVDLASLSRRQELHPELRARMHAIGPVLLALVRNRDAASAALARQHDRLVERWQRGIARLPVLRAELERLQDRRADMFQQRRRALQELVSLDAELRRLSHASGALARRMVMLEAAHRARAEPDAARPAQDRVGQNHSSTAVAGALVRGYAGRSRGAVQVSRAGMARAIRVAAVPRAPESRQVRLAPTLAVRQPLPRASRPLAARYDLASAAGQTGMAVAPLARVSVGMSAASLTPGIAPGRLPSPAPIRPSRAMAALLNGHGQETAITIAAVPGQRVAAPQDGRIVFADAFKSYGLLLIIEHGSEYHTLLWGFSRLRVAVDEVRDGEILGVMDVIDGVPPRLGMELRRRGRPVDPLPWLAASSSKVRG